MTEEWNGLLLVDKPADQTSHDVVQEVRRKLKQRSVGHTGTLDPLATGLLVLVVGEATKLSDYLQMTDKTYQLKVRLGVTTDTLDRTGKVLSEAPASFPPAHIVSAVEELEGDFQWPIPLFSAAKIEGRKLYEYGRAGESIELPLKEMSFWGSDIHELSPSSLNLTLSCSKGSFVRTWAAQLGERLGVGGIIDELRRLKVGDFDVQQAIPLSELESRLQTEGREGLQAQGTFVPMSGALPSWKSVAASEREARLVFNGQVPRDMVNRLVFEQKQAQAGTEPVYIKVVTPGGHLLAILAAEPRQGLKIRRVFRSFA